MTAAAIPRPWWRHQQEALAFVETLWAGGRTRGAMLAFVMGGGKTRVAIELARRRQAPAVLVLSPLRVVDVWRAQLAEYAPEFECLALNDRAGAVAAKTRLARERLVWAASKKKPLAVCINYESARSDPFASWALGQVWGMVIADESHRLASPSGRTSRWVARVGMQSHWRLALTGTPFSHSPLSIWGQYRFLHPGLFEPTFGQFQRHYAQFGGYRDQEIVGWQDLEGLERLFRRLAFRVDERVLDLPPELDQTLEVSLPAEAARVYDGMEQDMIAWIGSAQFTAANAMVRLLRLQQITGGTVKDDTGAEHLLHTAKESLLADLLEDLDEPVVVFARFTSDLAAIRRAASEVRMLCGELSGQHDDLAAWQRGRASDPRVLAVQIQAGGIGVDLTRARIAIYYSLGFSLTDYQQSRARVRRPPQQRPCVFYHLQVRNSIDPHVLQAIERRHDLVDSVLDHLREKKGEPHGRPGRRPASK